MNKSGIPNKCLLTENTDKLAHAPLPSNDVLFSGASFATRVGSHMRLESRGVGLATSLAVTSSTSPPRCSPACPAGLILPSHEERDSMSREMHN